MPADDAYMDIKHKSCRNKTIALRSYHVQGTERGREKGRERDGVGVHRSSRHLHAQGQRCSGA